MHLHMCSVRPTREICLSIQITLASSQNDFTKLDTLLDLGANAIFIDKTWAEKHKMPLMPLWNPIPVYNVDETWNSAGSITHIVELVVKFQGHCEKITAEVMDLGKNSFILEFSWLQCHNPDINWTKGTVKMTHCLWHCHMIQPKSAFLASLKKEEYSIQYQVHKTICVLKAQHEIPKEKTPEELVPKKYHKFLKVFLKKESKHMPLQKPWDHTIDLKDTFKPKKGHIIPLLPAEQEEVTVLLDDQLKKGYIRPSKSPQTSPVFFIPKKDGKKWMVYDYWYLNKHMIKNNYSLLLIAQLVNKLQGAKLFTKMDLRWGYNNVHIKENDEWKAAFTCFHGSFEPLIMYFRLCNLPTTFQAMINEIFTYMDDVVVVYIDNLIIFTKTENQAEHDKIVLEVLRRLEENDLFVKPKKCTFCATEVDFLSMIVRCDRIKMDQEKVKAILEWPEPKTVKGVRSFLRLANFYRRFIKDYTKVARPLHDLTKKESPFLWEEPQQVMSDTLKLHFTTAPILAFPDIDCVFCLESNASNYATGAVLSIEKEGVWHPVTFTSHSMTLQEWNYPIADKRCFW